MKKIIIDAFGGDYAPDEIILGAINAYNKDNSLELVLVGKQDIIEAKLLENNFDKNNVEILNADTIIDNDESPTVALKQKKDSSIAVSFDALKTRDDCGAFISCGSSGAVLTASVLKLGRIKGVSRPALAPLLPTIGGGKVLLIDCGANMDCKAINLLHFAQMGKSYMNTFGVKNPRVALLNVGVEDHKGNALCKEAFELLKSDSNINFVGNIEARDALSGDYDIIVTDGFSGNVLLKSSEGAIKLMSSELKESLTHNFVSKIGALLTKKSLKSMKDKLDYTKLGGAVFVGVKKIVIKSHGNSKASSVFQTIFQAKTLLEKDIVNEIEKNITIEQN